MKKSLKITGHILVRTIEVVVASVLVGFGLLLGRLYASPLEVKEFLPTLEKYILPVDSGVKLEAGSVTLQAAFRHEGLFHISIQNMKVIRLDGKTALRLPNVEISYDLWSLLKLDYTPDAVTIKDAFLRLTIDENGKFYLYGDTQDIPDAVKIDEIGVPLDEKKEPNLRKIGRRILSFDTISMQNARVLIDDRQLKQKISLPQVAFELERQFGLKHAMKAEATLMIEGEKTLLTAEAQLDRITRKMSFDAEFNTLNLTHLGRIIPALAEANLTVSGHFKGIFGFDKSCRTVLSCFKETSFQLKTLSGGTLNLPPPLTNVYQVKSATINGAIDENLNHIKIAKSLVQLEGGPDATLEVDVVGIGNLLNGGNLENVKTVLKSHISTLPMEKVPAVWPVETGPDAHRWVRENLSQGTVDFADFTLYFTGGELVDLYGELPVREVKVRYLDDMTPVEGFDGTVQLWPDRVLITGKKAEIGDLKLTDAIIDLTDLDKEVSRADIRLGIQGPVRQAMELISEKPLEFPQMFGLNPTKTGGTARVQVNLAFPLIDDLTTEQVKALVKAEIKDGVFPTPLADESLKKGALDLTVDNQQLIVKGSGVIAGIPLDLKWTESFTATQPTDTQSVYQITGEIQADTVTQQIPVIKPYLGGKGVLTAGVEKTMENQVRGTLQMHLKDAEMNLTPISVHKPVSSEANLMSEIEIWPDKNRGRIQFALEGLTDAAVPLPFHIGGHGSWGEKLEIILDEVVAPDTNFKAAFTQTKAGKIALNIAGESWDASGIYTSESNTPAQEAKTVSNPAEIEWPQEMDLSVDLNQLIFEKNMPIKQIYIQGSKIKNIWKTLSARAVGSKDFRLDYQPKQQKLVAETADLGDLLMRLGITKDIIGGEMTLEAKQQKEGGLDGTIVVRDLALKEPGFLVQAFSILGIVDGIRGEDLNFSEAYIPFKIRTTKGLLISLGEAYLAGTSLGITFGGDITLPRLNLSGSVIPAYLINSLPGKIPLIGGLFKDGEGGGLIGVKYDVTGVLSQPQVSFNPIQSMAPGILGKLFK